MASGRKEKQVAVPKEKTARKDEKKTSAKASSGAKEAPVKKKATAVKSHPEKKAAKVPKAGAETPGKKADAEKKVKKVIQAKPSAVKAADKPATAKKPAAAVKPAPEKKASRTKTPAVAAAQTPKEDAAPDKAVAKSSPAAKKTPPKAAGKTTSAEAVEVSEAPVTSDKARFTTVNTQFLVSVAQAIKNAVLPMIQSLKGREIVSDAPSGDVTFQIDRVAEKALNAYLQSANLPLSLYSEDVGYSTITSKPPKHLLIVDPIDGTRAAKNGFEGCVVALASTRVLERPTIGDIECACVMELTADRYFVAERGKGAKYYVNGSLKRPKLSANTDLEALTWSMTVPARPAELIFPTAARLIDLSSLKGGFFSCNSTSFSLTRLLTNQMDACVDFANRYYRDMPEELRKVFHFAGKGKVIGIAPYDMAAALLIAQESGCIVTDAYGQSFDDLLLTDTTEGNHRSLIAAANKALHDKLLTFFEARIQQYQEKLKLLHN
ncbi:MAG TPA: inositol monophosphatase family protein [Candidatus Hydrogenedentes bacterium]|nr:inositol monophosphatase family protein [Candidatus Hydrogenedentota bacterium]